MKEKIKEFLQLLEQDETLRKKYLQAQNETELGRIIQEAGFSFGPEDYRQTVKKLQQEAGIELLTDDELDGAAGGATSCDPVCSPCTPNCDPSCSPKCTPACSPRCSPYCVPVNHHGCTPCAPCAPLCGPCGLCSIIY